MKVPLLLMCLLSFEIASSQSNSVSYLTELKPYNVKGRNITKRNLSFGVYSTTKLRRSPASIFYVGTINPLNTIARVGTFPLAYTENYKRKDIYRFHLKRSNKEIIKVESKARVQIKEQFSPFNTKESLTSGQRNIDILEASILYNSDTTNIWHMLAENLDGSNEKEQKGRIKSRLAEISFKVENLVLSDDQEVEDGRPGFMKLQKVYAFSHNGKIIGAVSVYMTKLKFWLDESLDLEIQDIIAAASAVLSLRQNLYK